MMQFNEHLNQCPAKAVYIHRISCIEKIDYTHDKITYHMYCMIYLLMTSSKTYFDKHKAVISYLNCKFAGEGQSNEIMKYVHAI
jgi:hypothetical protein